MRYLNLIVAGVMAVAAAAGEAWAQPRVYVSAQAAPGGDGVSWNTAFDSLEAGLDAAEALAGLAGTAGGGAPVEIWVAAGLYRPEELQTPGVARTQSFRMRSGVSILGGFAGSETHREQRNWLTNVTVLSGDLLGDDQPEFTNRGENAFTVVTARGVNNAELDGFTVTAGAADPTTFPDGGGMRVASVPQLPLATGPRVVACRFFDNRARRGAAVYVAGGTARFEGCLFEANIATGFEGSLRGGGALGVGSGGVLRVDDSVVRFNFALGPGGGVVVLAGGTLTAVGNTFFNNQALLGGGAISGLGSGSAAALTVVGCRFVANSAGTRGGGIEHAGAGAPLVLNSTFQANSAAEGAGGALLFSGESSPEVVQCTIAGNFGQELTGGGLFADAGSTVRVRNTILWANATPDPPSVFTAQVGSAAGANVNRRRTTVQGTLEPDGFGNNGLDPLLIDLDGANGQAGDLDDDLRLPAGSPAVDSGDATFLPPDVADLDRDGNVEEPTPLDFDGRPRRFDDPATPNTGPGLPPHVDRGAFERGTPERAFVGQVGSPGFGQVGNPEDWQGQVVPGSGTRAVFDERSLTGPNDGVTLAVGGFGAALGGLSVRSREVTVDLANASLILTGEDGAASPPLLVDGPAAATSRVALVNSGPNGALATPGILLGSRPGFAGRLDLSGPGARLLNAGPATFGDGGRAFVGLNSLSLLETPGLLGGGAAGGFANVLVEGGSVLRLTSPTGALLLGDAGSAGVTVQNLGLLTNTGELESIELGRLAGASGSLRVVGANTSAILASRRVTIGGAGEGEVSVEDRGSLRTTTNGPVSVGAQGGGVGRVMIGVRALWRENAAPVVVGPAGRGEVEILGQGALQAPAGTELRKRGTLAGLGRVDGPLANGGRILPGGLLPGSVGTLTVNGPFTQSLTPAGQPRITGLLSVDLGGLLPGSQHDQLLVNGPLTLAGGLEVRLAPGFTPAPGNQFEIVRATQPGGLGRYDVAIAPALPGGRFVDIRYQGPRGAGASVFSAIDSIFTAIAFSQPISTFTVGAPRQTALPDVNNDGRPDLVVVAPDPLNPTGANGRLVVRLNSGTPPAGSWLGFNAGTTTIFPGREPTSVAAGDLNNDGLPDLAVANASSNTVTVYRNNGAGSFTLVQTINFVGRPVAVALADFDRGLDERPDLITVLETAGTVQVHRRVGPDGTISFTLAGTAATGLLPGAVAAFDPDQIKDIRLAVVNTGSDSVSVFRNTGAPGAVTFARVDYAVGAQPTAVAAGQFGTDSNNRRIYGLVTSNEAGGSLSVLTAVGAGADFAPAVDVPVGAAALGVTMLDVDLDGDLDLGAVVDVGFPSFPDLRVQMIRNDLATDRVANEQLTLVLDALVGAGTNPGGVASADVTGDALGRAALVTLNDELPGSPASQPNVQTLVNTSVVPPPSCVADVVGIGGFPPADGELTVDDYTSFINAFAGDDLLSDVVGIGGFPPPDGLLTVDDYTSFINSFAEGCP